MRVSKGLKTFGVFADLALATPQVASAQKNDALKVFQDSLAALQRELLEQQQIKDAERRIDEGTSTLEEEKKRLEDNARIQSVIDAGWIDQKANLERQKAQREDRQRQEAEQQAIAQRQSYEAKEAYNAELLRRVKEGDAERRRILDQQSPQSSSSGKKAHCGYHNGVEIIRTGVSC